MSRLESLSSDARLVVWFLRRPPLYRELGRRLASRFQKRIPERRTEAAQWCADNAVDTAEATRQLIGTDKPPLRERFPEAFAEAAERMRECPEVMGGAGNIDLLYDLCEAVEATRVVETGVAYGWSSLALLLSLDSRAGHLISTDMPYPGQGSERFVGCVVPERLRTRWSLLRRPDRDVLPGAIAQLGGLDLCHYDSDKSARGRLWAYPLMWEALRPGGYLVSDDISDNVAFRDFCAEMGVPPTVVADADGPRMRYVGVAVKPG
jgi:hypothetical protein